jgi:ankyrin repeat protein
VSAKDIFGSTPLHDAANEAVAAKLLAFGGDLHMKSKTGNCPLHRAASNGRIGVARLLLNCGANLQAKSNTGRTALALAHQFEEVDMVNLLQQLENLSSG